jgi:hypothetical protein
MHDDEDEVIAFISADRERRADVPRLAQPSRVNEDGHVLSEAEARENAAKVRRREAEERRWYERGKR